MSRYEALPIIADVYNRHPGKFSTSVIMRVMAGVLDGGPDGVRMPQLAIAAQGPRTNISTIKTSLLNAGLITQVRRREGLGSPYAIFPVDRLASVVAGYNVVFTETLAAETGIGEDGLLGVARQNANNTRALVESTPGEDISKTLPFGPHVHPESALMRGLEGVAADLGRLIIAQNEVDRMVREYPVA